MHLGRIALNLGVEQVIDRCLLIAAGYAISALVVVAVAVGASLSGTPLAVLAIGPAAVLGFPVRLLVERSDTSRTRDYLRRVASTLGVIRLVVVVGLAVAVVVAAR
jgi:hypothetical protein